MKRRVKSYTRRQGRHSVRVRSHVKNFRSAPERGDIEDEILPLYKLRILHPNADPRNSKEYIDANKQLDALHEQYDVAMKRRDFPALGSLADSMSKPRDIVLAIDEEVMENPPYDDDEESVVVFYPEEEEPKLFKYKNKRRLI